MDILPISAPIGLFSGTENENRFCEHAIGWLSTEAVSDWMIMLTTADSRLRFPPSSCALMDSLKVPEITTF